MLSPESFTIRSSWPISAPAANPETPEQLLTGPDGENLFRQSLKLHQGSFEFDPETMVEVESCIQLKCPSPESDKALSQCELTFECLGQTVSVSRLVLVSQCKRIEVYGPSGEYQLTKEGVLLGDPFSLVAFELA